jgi:hypothetical protein
MHTTKYVMQLHIGMVHNTHNFTLHKHWPSSSKFQLIFKVVNSKVKLECNGNAKKVEWKTRVLGKGSNLDFGL